MGVLGLGLVWRHIVWVEPSARPIAEAILLIGLFLLVTLMTLYALRTVRYRTNLIADANTPATLNFIATFSISVLLAAEALRPHNLLLAHIFFLIGTFAGLAIAVRSVHCWFTKSIDAKDIDPGWFLPVVGNLVAPSIAAPLGYATIGWLILGFGLIGWFMLLPLIVYRLIVEPELPKSLRPTLFIMIAPPGLATSAFIAMNGPVQVLWPALFFGFGLFFCLCLAAMVRDFLEVPFQLSWWSYTFPLHAMTIAAFSLDRAFPLPGLTEIAFLLTGITTTITGWVCIKATSATLSTIRGQKS